jgi:multisubunit Na+/H+ antiporter MnhG subunit
MLVPVQLAPWVKGVQEFQQLGLVNKAVLGAVAIDIPFITFSKSPEERKERAFKEALIMLMAFVVAPVHSTLLAKFFWQSL